MGSVLTEVLGGHQRRVRPLCALMPAPRGVSPEAPAPVPAPASASRLCPVLRTPGPTAGLGWDAGFPGSRLDAVPLRRDVWASATSFRTQDDLGQARPRRAGEGAEPWGPGRVSGKGPKVHRTGGEVPREIVRSVSRPLPRCLRYRLRGPGRAPAFWL